MAKLEQRELLAAINAARSDALGADDNETVSDRADALDRYYGRPYGNESEGRSAVVSKDLSDTVDWIMPSLIRIFAGGDAVVQFAPVGPEDEEPAQQETDYVNHVVTQENPWAVIAHDGIKDALMLRNGYFKAYWEDYKRPQYAPYTGLSADQLGLVIEDTVEVVEQREYLRDGETLYDIKVRTYDEGGKCCIEAVPPEELLVHKGCRGSIASASYVEHRPPTTRSDLLEMGLSKDFVEGLPKFSDSDGSNADVLARDPSQSDDADHTAYHMSVEPVDYREVYIRIDYDGDGVAELRRVVVCGDQIPPGKEWNREVECIPFASMTPNRMPHRHVGRSIADEVEDIAEIKTAVWRSMLDNGYINNNPRMVVGPNVNLSDLLVSRPGGLIRTTGIPSQDVMPLMPAPMMGQMLEMIAYADQVKGSRTGVDRNSTGLDANTLRESTKGAYLAAMGQANQKIELIARMFAETAIKDLFLLVHGILLKNQDHAKVIRIRGKYVPVDPTTWRTRYDLTVSVGLGTGSAEEQVQKVMAMGQAQMQLVQMGLVGPEQAFALFEVMCKALGFKNPDKFALNPSSDEYKQQMANKQPEKDPALAVKELEVQGRMQVVQAEQPMKQADLQLRQYEIDQNTQLEREKAGLAAAQAQAERESKEAMATMQARIDLLLAEQKNQIAQVGQMVKVVGDAQNRMAIGGPGASNFVDVGSDGAQQQPSIGEALVALAEGQRAMAEGQARLVDANGQIAELLAKPKHISINRDAEGKAIGAVSKVGG